MTKILYKYFPPDLVAAVKTRLIRFTQPGDFNDPLEFLPAFLSKNHKKQANETSFQHFKSKLIQRGETKNESDLFKAWRSPSFKGIRKAYQDFSAHIAALNEKPRLDAIIEMFSQKLGVFCLSEIRDSPLMWGHYAKNHEGFVLGFDRFHPFFASKNSASEFQLLRRVSYARHRLECPENKRNLLRLLTLKSQKWCYEKEWRMIRLLSDANKMKRRRGSRFHAHLFEFPPDVVTEVIFGAKCPQSLKKQLCAHVESWGPTQHQHVNFFEIHLDAVAYKLQTIKCIRRKNPANHWEIFTNLQLPF